MKKIFLTLSMLSSCFCFGMQITRADQEYSVFDVTTPHTVKPYMASKSISKAYSFAHKF